MSPRIEMYLSPDRGYGGVVVDSTLGKGPNNTPLRPPEDVKKTEEAMNQSQVNEQLLTKTKSL